MSDYENVDHEAASKGCTLVIMAIVLAFIAGIVVSEVFLK